MAGEVCNPETENCPPPPCEKNCTTICHNIGGPMELGANCDGATGARTYTLDTGQTFVVPLGHFLGIIISAGPKALAAHLSHGDGFAEIVFDPPLHLASTGQNH